MFLLNYFLMGTMFLIMVMVVTNSKNERLHLIEVGDVNTNTLANFNRKLHI